jgi:hypothetical protein
MARGRIAGRGDRGLQTRCPTGRVRPTQHRVYQWQVSANQGLTAALPYYSVHAVGFQSNFILPPKSLNFFFKYELEYLAKARPQGRTIVFGLSWTLRDPKPQPPKQ